MPEELRVKEVFVTKGLARKKMRPQGRGRTGIGLIKKTHVTLKTEVIDFQAMIDGAKTPSQKRKWQVRKEMVEKLKSGPSAVPRMGIRQRERLARKNASEE